MACRINNKNCDDEPMRVNQSATQHYGNCYSFNLDGPITASGKHHGLKIFFNLEILDTLGLFSSKSGLKVFISKPGMVGRNGGKWTTFQLMF